MKPSIIVNRNSFIDWTKGILLDRDAYGICVVYDDNKNQEAMNLLDAGEVIGFEVKGELVSIMKLENNGFVETKLDCENVKMMSINTKGESE